MAYSADPFWLLTLRVRADCFTLKVTLLMPGIGISSVVSLSSQANIALTKNISKAVFLIIIKSLKGL